MTTPSEARVVGRITRVEITKERKKNSEDTHGRAGEHSFPRVPADVSVARVGVMERVQPRKYPISTRVIRHNDSNIAYCHLTVSTSGRAKLDLRRISINGGINSRGSTRRPVKSI